MVRRLILLLCNIIIITEAGFKVFVPMDLGENLPYVLDFKAPYKDGVTYNISAKQDNRSPDFELKVQNDIGELIVTEPPQMKAYRGYAIENPTQRLVVTAKVGGVEVYYLDTPPARTLDVGPDYYIVDFAFDVDNIYYELAGNNIDSVMMRIDKNMALIHEVYERDLKIIYNTVFIVLRASASSCPYRNHIPYSKTVIDRMKWQIGFWKSEFNEDEYDLAHVITGECVGSGVASRGSICEPGSVTYDNPNGKYAGSSYSDDNDDFEFYRIMRHELGHSWGSDDHYTGDSPDGPTIMWGNSRDFFAEVVMENEMLSFRERDCIDKQATPIFVHKSKPSMKSSIKINSLLVGNKLTIDLNGSNFSAELFDVKGKLIKSFVERKLESNKVILNLDNKGRKLANGEYLLKISIDGKKISQKILNQN